jgi:hypothetical protein
MYFDLVRIKVDLYSGCDSDATSNKIVAMEKRYYYEVIVFLSRRYFVFSSCCLVILIIYFYGGDNLTYTLKYVMYGEIGL